MTSERPKQKRQPRELSLEERQAMWNKWWDDFLAPIIAEMQEEEEGEHSESPIMKPEV